MFIKSILRKNIRNLSFNNRQLTKKMFCQNNKKDEEITDFYKFMDENIKKDKAEETVTDKNQTYDDVNILLDIIKCPMTEMELTASDKGLSVGHIIYPKRNGIYILLEEEAQFNFE
jgi:hypothetical protein